MPPEAVAVTRNLPKLPGGPSWNIESVGNQNVDQRKSFDLPAQEKFRIVGWAVDQQAKNAAGGVEVAIDGGLFAAEYGKPRPDVAKALGVPAYADAGYTIELLGQQFSPGKHSLSVRVLTHDRKAYWEAGPYTINIK